MREIVASDKPIIEANTFCEISSRSAPRNTAFVTTIALITRARLNFSHYQSGFLCARFSTFLFSYEGQKRLRINVKLSPTSFLSATYILEDFTPNRKPVENGCERGAHPAERIPRLADGETGRTMGFRMMSGPPATNTPSRAKLMQSRPMLKGMRIASFAAMLTKGAAASILKEGTLLGVSLVDVQNDGADFDSYPCILM